MQSYSEYALCIQRVFRGYRVRKSPIGKYVRICTTLQKLNKLVKFKATKNDGRIDSAIDENRVVDAIKTLFKPSQIRLTSAKSRCWYDIMIGDIPINIKITSGRASDNIFCKKGVFYTLCGTIYNEYALNYNDWFQKILEHGIVRERTRNLEYHFLVLFKNSGRVMFKSILDIQCLCVNPTNILQVNWNTESSCKKLIRANSKTELLQKVQFALRLSLLNSATFTDADLSNLFI